MVIGHTRKSELIKNTCFQKKKKITFKHVFLISDSFECLK